MKQNGVKEDFWYLLALKPKYYCDRMDYCANKLRLTIYTDETKTQLKGLGDFLEEVAVKWTEL